MGFVYRVLLILKALWIILSEIINVLKTIYVRTADITSARYKVPYGQGPGLPQGPWKLQGFWCSLVLSELCFEGFWYKTGLKKYVYTKYYQLMIWINSVYIFFPSDCSWCVHCFNSDPQLEVQQA